MLSHSMFTASFAVFISQFILSSCNKSSCNKIVNKYAQPLHVYRLLQCFLSQFIIFLKVLLR